MSRVSGPQNYQLFKVLLTADLAGIPLRKDYSEDSVILRLNGLEVRGANASIRTLAKLCRDVRVDFFGKGLAEYAKVEEMIDWVALSLEPYLDLWLQARANQVDDNVASSIRADVRNQLAELEMQLTGEYCVGNSFTLADVCLLAALFKPLTLEAMVSPESNIFRYVSNLSKMESVSRIFGLFGQASEENTATLHGNVNDIRGKLENGDIEALWPEMKVFSLWIVKYRFVEYNVVLSVSQHKVKKFMNLCLNKQKICGCLSVNGDKSPFEITGALVFEGNDLPRFLDDSKDANFYFFEKVNWTEKDKLKFSEYLNGSNVDSKPVQERKFF